MPLRIVRNNIVDIKADAIVNTANPCVTIGSGVDRAIHEKAGARLFEERRKIGVMEPGQAAITPAFDLNAKYVIHTVAPAWFGGINREAEILEQCYENSLKLAMEHNCKTVAFPLLATGNYEYPKDLALQVATSAIGRFLLNSDLPYEPTIYLVVFDMTSYQLSAKLREDIESYIDECRVEQILAAEYQEVPKRVSNFAPLEGITISESLLEKRADVEDKCANTLPMNRKIDNWLKELGETFSEALLRMIDERGLTDPEVYHRANIDRKLFSKIRKDKHYNPSKKTAIAFAIALELNLDETRDLLGKAGYTLSRGNLSDLVVEYFLVNEIYDMFELEAALFALKHKAL